MTLRRSTRYGQDLQHHESCSVQIDAALRCTCAREDAHDRRREAAASQRARDARAAIRHEVAEIGKGKFHALFEIPADWFEPGSTSILKGGARVYTHYFFHTHIFATEEKARNLSKLAAEEYKSKRRLSPLYWKTLSAGFVADFYDYDNGLMT